MFSYLPEQSLDFIAMTIREEIQLAAEGIVPELLLNEGCQTIGRLSEIDRRTVNKDLCNAIVGA